MILNVLALIEAVQVVLVVGRWMPLLPWQGFLLFVAGALLIGQVLKVCHDKNASFRAAFQWFAIVEGVLTALLLCAVYKRIIYDYQPVLAQRAFDVLMI